MRLVRIGRLRNALSACNVLETASDLKVSTGRNYCESLEGGEGKELTDTQLPESADIVKNPAAIEFCGAIRLSWESGSIDYSIMGDGATILAPASENIKNADVTQIRRMVRIENRTSYYEYICNEQKADELVL